MEPADIFIILGIIFGTVLTGVIFWKVVDLIKVWINRNKNSYDEEKFDRLAKAFIQYRKENNRRLEHIETIIGDQELDASTAHQTEEKTVSNQRIEIEDSETASEEDQASPSSKNLTNMLNRREA